MYTIDTKSNEKYFIVINNDSKNQIKIAKSCNTLEDVKRFVGIINLKEVIE